MDAVRFQCVKGCINCCDVPGWVYLTEDDLRRIAAFLGMEAEDFEGRYVYRTKHRLRLRKPRHSQCEFLTKDGCRIHRVKPTQCRLFPFWPELVEDRDAWDETARRCPGIGIGPLIQIGAAVEIAHEMREAYPAQF